MEAASSSMIQEAKRAVTSLEAISQSLLKVESFIVAPPSSIGLKLRISFASRCCKRKSGRVKIFSATGPQRLRLPAFYSLLSKDCAHQPGPFSQTLPPSVAALRAGTGSTKIGPLKGLTLKLKGLPLKSMHCAIPKCQPSCYLVLYL